MKKRSITILVYCVLFTANYVFAGISGTLAGKVLDKSTGNPLPGANVIIVNSHFGSASNEKGQFLVNNIPAGTFTVKATMMGYNTLIIEKVTILMDLRTSLTIELEPKVLEGQEVTVTADASMIKKDVTATTHFINRQEITHLPVQSFTEVVDIQPGVAAGHIRGGRQEEVLYLVDGFPIQDVIEGKVGNELPMNSIIDMTVQTGGFNAEYGNAMSGVVNILTQDGGEDINSVLEFSGLNYASFSNPYIDKSPDMDYITEMFMGGPLFTQKLKFYVAADFRTPNTRWKREEFGQKLSIYNSESSKNMNFNAKLSYYISNSFKIKLQGLLSLWDWNEYVHNWKMNLEGLPDRSKKSYRFSATAVHTINPKTFWELRISQYNVLKSIYGASSIELYNPEFDETGHWIVAGDYPWWLDHQEVHTTGKFDFTSQVTHHHQLKTGVEYVYYDLYKKNVQRLEILTYDPDFPQYISYNTDYRYFPTRGAAYIQDKIDYEGMVVNVGLRYDFLDPKASRPAIEEKIYGKRHEWIVNHDQTVDADIKHQISPRVGLAIPMGPKQELHVNYGWFFQMPLFDYLYTNANLNLSEGFSPLGDPDLEPAKTISYEISYKNQIGNKTLFDFTVFNKEISNLVDNNTYLNESDNSLSGSGYTQYVNLENVNVWGSEVFLKRDVSQFLSGKISYTFMTAKGTGSETTQKFSWITRQTLVPINEYYLSWDQRHTLVTNIDIRKPNNWGINILWRWNSPLPYTKNEGAATEPNNSRMDENITLDLRMNKEFNLLGIPCSAFGEFLNLLDRENTLWYDSNGLAGGIYGDPGAYDMRFRYRVGINMNLF